MKGKNIAKYGFLGVITCISIFPFYMMFVMSTHKTEDLFVKLQLLPGSYLWENLKTILGTSFLKYYSNSIFVSVFATILSVLVSAMAGYGIAKYEFRFKKAIYYFVLTTMMVPAQLGIVAYVLEMRMLGLNNTLIPLITYFSANAFSVYWMHSFMLDAVDHEILESARIDGCSELGMFFKIVLPLVIPALITISMLIFLWSWNNYLLPLVIVNEPAQFTIPLGIATLSTKYRTDLGAQLLEMSLSVFPIIFLFSFGLKYFIQGLTAGAVKG